MKQRDRQTFKVAIVVMMAVNAVGVNSQTILGATGTWTGKESKEEVMRRMIDIDMSVPDFKTSTIDQGVMGWRLAKIIDALQKNYRQSNYNRNISQIRYELTEDDRIRFAETDNLTFLEVEKRDSVIFIKWHTLTRFPKKEKVEHDITFKLVNGVSDNESVNNLFKDISRYVRPDEEE